jgi:hypothetical protein
LPCRSAPSPKQMFQTSVSIKGMIWFGPVKVDS